MSSGICDSAFDVTDVKLGPEVSPNVIMRAGLTHAGVAAAAGADPP